MTSGKTPVENMLWGGRFTGGLDPLMIKYNESILYDKLLYKEDILGRIAFARANAKSGIISNNEFTEIERGLREEVQKEWEADTFVIMPDDEDIHTIDSRFGEDVSATFDYERSVEMRSAKGGTSRARVLEQVKVLKAMLA